MYLMKRSAAACEAAHGHSHDEPANDDGHGHDDGPGHVDGPGHGDGHDD